MGLSPKGEQVLQITIACGVLETVAILLRLLARYKTKAKYGIDDWLIVATLIPSCGMLIAGSFSEYLRLRIAWVTNPRNRSDQPWWWRPTRE